MILISFLLGLCVGLFVGYCWAYKHTTAVRYAFCDHARYYRNELRKAKAQLESALSLLSRTQEVINK